MHVRSACLGCQFDERRKAASAAHSGQFGNGPENLHPSRPPASLRQFLQRVRHTGMAVITRLTAPSTNHGGRHQLGLTLLTTAPDAARLGRSLARTRAAKPNGKSADRSGCIRIRTNLRRNSSPATMTSYGSRVASGITDQSVSGSGVDAWASMSRSSIKPSMRVRRTETSASPTLKSFPMQRTSDDNFHVTPNAVAASKRLVKAEPLDLNVMVGLSG